MVEWYEAEAALANEIIWVDVSDILETDKIPIKDLTNREMRTLQQDPDLKNLPGDFDKLSPKSHTLGLLITYQRMSKGREGNLGFSFEQFLNWRTSTTNRLMERFREALGDVEKKSEILPSPMQDKPSETP